jgi:glycosyltransferase involved in cell wall biosynthesis
VLVGGGPDEAELRAAASKGVVFAGMTTKVPLWLTAADVIALPSRWEGMSLTMLEAMAAGRSVIISDVPGAREAVRAGAGAVVPVEDPVALSEALIKRLTDPLITEAEGREARRLAEELFGLERTLKATQEAYESVLDPGR